MITLTLDKEEIDKPTKIADMTLRDFFAAFALVAMASEPREPNPSPVHRSSAPPFPPLPVFSDLAVRRAFKLADVMLAERGNWYATADMFRPKPPPRT